MIIVKQIGRKKYDARILELVKNYDVITLSVAKRLFYFIQEEYGDYPDITKDTIKYLRKIKKWQPDADQFFREAIRRWAALRSMKRKR